MSAEPRSVELRAFGLRAVNAASALELVNTHSPEPVPISKPRSSVCSQRIPDALRDLILTTTALSSRTSFVGVRCSKSSYAPVRDPAMTSGAPATPAIHNRSSKKQPHVGHPRVSLK